MHKCYEVKRFKKAITLKILLSLLSLKNIKNIKFCLKKVIKKYYLNINYKIIRLSLLITRNL